MTGPAHLCPDCGERHGEGACTERTRTRLSEAAAIVLPGYRILGRLGAGAMGAVHLGEDVTLGRRVAIKVVAPDLASDEGAQQRFLREARAMASVQHPNVVRIYSFGEHEGMGYIVMELIEGESLRDHLGLRKTLEVEEALRITRDVALALEAAWAKGIVHRDVKPSNILLDPARQVHVADFGLARPTATGDASITARGTLVGTPDYVSPEQARGDSLDCRSDIYSLGIVLYEMLAGAKPFTAPTPVAVVAKHIHEPLPSLHSVVHHLPAPVVELVERMTSKDPDQRPPSYASLRHDLEVLLEEGAPAKPRWLAGARGLVVAAVVLSTVAVLLLRFFDRPDRPPASVQVEKLTSRGTVREGTLSSDGRYLAYATEDSALWLKDLREKTEVRLVEGSNDARAVIQLHGFSPDGSYVFYSSFPPMRRDLQLFRLPLIGGTPQHVTDGSSFAVSAGQTRVAAETNEGIVVLDADGTGRRRIAEKDYSPVAWFPNGERLLLFRAGSFFAIDSRGGEEVKIFEVAGFAPGNAISFRSDGQVLAFATQSAGGAETSLYALDVRAGEARPMGERWDRILSLEWLPDGRGLLANGADRDDRPPQIWLVSYPDGGRRTIPGDSIEYQSVRLTADGNGVVARQGLSRSQILVSTNGELSSFKRLLTGTDVEFSLCWTRSGEILFSSNEASTEGFYDLYVLNPQTEARRRLTHDPAGSEVDPAVSPDGRYVVFTSQRENESSLWRVNIDGTDLRKLATASIAGRVWMRPQVSPDSQWVMYMDEVDAVGGPWEVLRRVSIDGGTVLPLIGPHDADSAGDRWRLAFGGGWSSRGDEIAFLHLTAQWSGSEWSHSTPLELAVSNLDGDTVQTFPYTPESFAVTWDHQRVQWSAEGADRFPYFSRDGQLWRQPIAGGPATPVTHLEEFLFDFDWSPDGERLAVSLWTTMSDLVRLTGFR